MRVGVVVRMEADTDIDEKFAEVRAMGMESCQLVCWERKIINDEKAAEAILAGSRKTRDYYQCILVWLGRTESLGFL